MVGKHGNIEGWETLYIDKSEGNAKAQIAIATDGTKVFHILKPISQKEKDWGFTLYQPSYESMKTEIKAMVKLYGRKEVERELGIFIY